MRNLLSIFLLLIMFLQTFSTYVLNADYRLNKNYVANNLCVNKSRPQLHCNGKCYLAKQVAKDNEQKQAPVNKKNTDTQPYFLQDIYLLQSVTFLGKQTYFNRQENILLPQLYNSVFHPPAV